MNSNTLSKRRSGAKKIITELRKRYPNAKCILNYSNTWELLVAVILSAQCTDKRVNIVTKKLFKKYKTLDDYVSADLVEFEQDIRSTGFYRNKAKNILSAAHRVKEEFGGKIPRTMEELITIPGAARKTANVVLGNAYGVVEGIAVDTHVIRLSRRFGLTNEKTPVKIEKDLMQVLNKKDWFEFTYLLIEYGRDACTARQKDIGSCPLDDMIVF